VRDSLAMTTQVGWFHTLYHAAGYVNHLGFI
jgi:hypothetical protein